jgi:amidase
MGGLAAVFRMARRTLAFWDTYDVLITPTVAITAPRVGEFQDPANSAGVFRYIALAAFTSPFNMTGQPAVNVPMGFDAAGMPRGVQLVGRPGDEATLIRLAAQMEAAHPWAGRRPPVS